MARKTNGAPKAQILESTVQEPAPAERQGPQAGILTLLGFGSAALGLALTVAPNLSWKAAQIMVGFDYLGVHGGALLMGGLVLIGLGSVLRRVHQIAAQVAQAGSDTGLLEHVAADVLQVGSVLESVERSLGTLRNEFGKEVSGLRTAVGQVAAEVKSQEGEGLGSEDAIFRLAASLDKVGAKIEERLKTQFSELTERIGQVERAVGENNQRSRLAQAHRDNEPASVHPAQPLHQTGYHRGPLGHEGLRAEFGLGETGFHGTTAPGAPRQAANQPLPLSEARFRAPQPPTTGSAPSNSLGLLDHLDDEGVRSPLPTQPTFDETLRLQVPAPAPGRWDAPGHEAAPLISDPEVRAALEDLGRKSR